MTRYKWLLIWSIMMNIFQNVDANNSTTEQDVLSLASSGMPTGYFLGDSYPVCWVQPPGGARYQINDCRSFNMSIAFDEKPLEELVIHNSYEIHYTLTIAGSENCSQCIYNMPAVPDRLMHANIHFCTADVLFCMPFLTAQGTVGTNAPSIKFDWNSTIMHFNTNFSTSNFEVGSIPTMLLHAMVMTEGPEGLYRWDIAYAVPFVLVNRMNYNFHQSWSMTLLYMVYGLTMGLICVYGLWTHLSYASKVVKYSQPLFLHLLLFGAIVYATSVLPASAEDTEDSITAIPIPESGWTHSSCMTKYWLASMGFAIMYGTLFAKMYRAYKVVTLSMRLQPIYVNQRFVIACIFVITLIFGVFMTIWQVLNPLMLQRVEISSESSVLMCVSKNSATGYLITWYFLQLIMVIAGCFLAYSGFSMNSVVNEARYIALALACLLQAFLTTLPVMFVVQDEPSLGWGIYCSTVLFCSNITLAFIFIPKMVAVHSYGDHVGELMSTISSPTVVPSNMTFTAIKRSSNSDSHTSKSFKSNQDRLREQDDDEECE